MILWCLQLHLALILYQYLDYARNGSLLKKVLKQPVSELACFWAGLFLNWPVSELACFWAGLFWNWPVSELACFELACLGTGLFWTGLFSNWPVFKLACFQTGLFWTGLFLNWPVSELACFDRPEKQADRTGLKIRPVFQADKTGLKLRTGLQMNSPIKTIPTTPLNPHRLWGVVGIVLMNPFSRQSYFLGWHEFFI